jgi:hypothetical protein
VPTAVPDPGRLEQAAFNEIYNAFAAGIAAPIARGVFYAERAFVVIGPICGLGACFILHTFAQAMWKVSVMTDVQCFACRLPLSRSRTESRFHTLSRGAGGEQLFGAVEAH